MQLYVGNKNYSSWSMRPWVLMKQRGIAFDEVMLRFDSFDANSTFKTTLALATGEGVGAVATASKVPMLVDNGFTVWDTLAIAEYLAEKFSSLKLSQPTYRPAHALAASAPKCILASADCAATAP